MHLLCEQFFQNFSFLILLIYPCLDSCLVLLRSKVWLEVTLFKLAILFVLHSFLLNLFDQLLLVHLLILLFEAFIQFFKFLFCFNATVKLLLLFHSHVFDSRYVFVESLSCLFADIACNQMILVPHVLSMVVNSEWTLRSHKLGYRRVIRM